MSATFSAPINERNQRVRERERGEIERGQRRRDLQICGGEPPTSWQKKALLLIKDHLKDTCSWKTLTTPALGPFLLHPPYNLNLIR